MTYQLRDTFILNGQEYGIEQIISNNYSWFNPYHYGFSPYYTCTACWRGYQCCYAINEGRLNLITLNINNNGDKYPTFKKIEADIIKSHNWFSASYNNIFFDFKVTGKVIVAKDFIYEKYRDYCDYPSI